MSKPENTPMPGEECSVEFRCDERHPGVESMRYCWYPSGHPTPHSWETLRPGESFDARNDLAFELPR